MNLVKYISNRLFELEKKKREDARQSKLPTRSHFAP